MSIFRTSSDFYDNPELYDLTSQGSPEELQFYIEEAKRLGGPVLELTCGTGRLTNELAQCGINCEGLDLSRLMLDHARQKASARNLNVIYHYGDMTNFDLGKQYQLVFVPINSLLHLHNLDNVLKFFACVRRHLTETGELIFAVFNPSLKLLSRDPSQRYEVDRFVDPSNGKEIILEETVNYNSATQVNHATWYYSYVDQKDVLSHPLHLKSLFPKELEAILRLADFKLLKKYGGYQREPFANASRTQVIVCEPN